MVMSMLIVTSTLFGQIPADGLVAHYPCNGNANQPSAGSDVPVYSAAGAADRASVAADSTFEVLHYRLDLIIPLATSALSGTVTMTCRSLTNNLHQVLLDMDSATVVCAVRKDSVALTPTYNEAEFKLTVPFSPSVALHDTFSLVVEYEVGSSNNGFYSYQMSAYTDWAAGWFPCHDFPWDKATFDLHIKVPVGVEVASVGRLADRSASGDGLWETFNWRTDHPVATHLVGMMMSRYYTRWSDWHVPSPADSVEIVYYIFDRDFTLARQDFVHIVAAMDFYATMFGPYPFEKYGMAETEPLNYGGMEYQSMSMISSRWIQGNLTAEDGFVHELAHQWWGDAVGFNDWMAMWLSEGFAEYSAALFTEHQYGAEAFRALMDQKKERYLQQTQSQDYSISDPHFDYSHINIVYKKGAWVLHMLRHVVGIETFWHILQDYYKLYKYSNATIADFQAVAEAVYGEDLTWFFDQWIYNLGYPLINATQVTTEVALGEFQCAVTLQQTQAAGPVFTMPLDLRLTAPGGQMDTTVWLNSSPQTFVFTLAFSPQGLEIDPLGKVLMETGAISLAVDQEPVILEEFSLSQNYPNPFNSSTTVSYSLPTQSMVRLRVIDYLGRNIAELVNGEQAAGYHKVEWNAKVASGTYFLRIEAVSVDDPNRKFVDVRKMLLMK